MPAVASLPAVTATSLEPGPAAVPEVVTQCVTGLQWEGGRPADKGAFCLAAMRTETRPQASPVPLPALPVITQLNALSQAAVCRSALRPKPAFPATGGYLVICQIFKAAPPACPPACHSLNSCWARAAPGLCCAQCPPLPLLSVSKHESHAAPVTYTHPARPSSDPDRPGG